MFSGVTFSAIRCLCGRILLSLHLKRWDLCKVSSWSFKNHQGNHKKKKKNITTQKSSSENLTARNFQSLKNKQRQLPQTTTPQKKKIVYKYKCLTFFVGRFLPLFLLRIHPNQVAPPPLPPSRVAFRYQREQSCWSCSVSVVAICEPSRGKSEVFFFRSWISSWIFFGLCGNIY